MIRKAQAAFTAASIAAAVSFMAPVSPGYAHEDHQALGAGPGPEVPTKAAVPSEVQAAPAKEGAAKEVMADAHEGMADAHEMAAGRHEQAADRNKTFGERLASWLGRLHTLVIHFPIAMFIGALGVELFGLWRRSTQYRSAAHVMLIVGALGAVIAAALGWFAGGFYLTDRNQLLMLHRWLGTAIAAAGLLLLYLSATARRAPERPRSVYWIALGAMTIAIAVQGYVGGSFMHGGMNHMAF